MTASLYQSAWSVPHGHFRGLLLRLQVPKNSRESVIFGRKRKRSSSHFENVRRNLRRIQFDVIAAALPGVTRIGEQIMNLERLLRPNLKSVQWHIDPTGLGVAGVQIHDDQ